MGDTLYSADFSFLYSSSVMHYPVMLCDVFGDGLLQHRQLAAVMSCKLFGSSGCHSVSYRTSGCPEPHDTPVTALTVITTRLRIHDKQQQQQQQQAASSEYLQLHLYLAGNLHQAVVLQSLQRSPT